MYGPAIVAYRNTGDDPEPRAHLELKPARAA